MDNPIYVALSRQMILRRQMDIVANNIANADTAAFKVEELMIRTDARPMPNADGSPNSINYVVDAALGRNYAQGALAQTGNPLDMAIEGDAFFQVAAADGERYTRDGRFTIDAQGRLVTRQGHPVQGDAGDIVVDVTRGPISVARDGAISQNGERIGMLSIVRFDERSGLTKQGDGLYVNASNSVAMPARDSVVHQAMIEGSNVNAIVQITDMIEINRAYERLAKIVSQTAELDKTAIQRLGAIA